MTKQVVKKKAVAPKPFTVARGHIMAAIEAAPGTVRFPRKANGSGGYALTTSFYRIPGQKGNSGFRVLWRRI